MPWEGGGLRFKKSGMDYKMKGLHRAIVYKPYKECREWTGLLLGEEFESSSDRGLGSLLEEGNLL